MDIQELIALANILDEQGEREAAEQVDAMIREAAQSFVPDDDEEFKKRLQEEGFESPQVYVGKPTSELSEQEREKMESDPRLKEMEEDQQKRMLESMHETLANAGYDVFRPGELEEWLRTTGHIKLDRDKWPSTTEMLGEEDQAMDPEYTRLLENQQGELSNMLDRFLENPMDNMAKKELMRGIEQYTELYSEGQELSQTEESFAAMKPMFEKLSNIADRLDKLGAAEHADMIDKFLKKHSGSVLPDVIEWKDSDLNGNRAKAYDTEHHHSLQVREPKTDQERVDFEGRKYHHVNTYESADKAKDTKKEAAPHGALQTRYSPDLVGVQLARVGDGVYQCPVTGKIYNFETGYTDMDGDYHPGSSVSAQTPDSTGYEIPHRMFDSREQILNRIN